MDTERRQQQQLLSSTYLIPEDVICSDLDDVFSLRPSKDTDGNEFLLSSGGREINQNVVLVVVYSEQEIHYSTKSMTSFFYSAIIIIQNLLPRHRLFVSGYFALASHRSSSSRRINSSEQQKKKQWKEGPPARHEILFEHPADRLWICAKTADFTLSMTNTEIRLQNNRIWNSLSQLILFPLNKISRD